MSDLLKPWPILFPVPVVYGRGHEMVVPDSFVIFFCRHGTIGVPFHDPPFIAAFPALRKPRAYRLTNESIATSGVGTVATAYTYDKGHNRVSKVVTGGSSPGTTSYTIGNGGNGGAANQIVSATLPGSVVAGYSHDANGNRTQRAQGGHTDVYSYDYENRLVGLNYQTGASGTTGMYNYSYDYRTRRTVRVEPAAGTTQIVFDRGTSIEEFGMSGPDFPGVEYLRGYNYGGGVGGLEYSVRSGFANFNQYDSRGDVVAQTNAAGTLTFQTGYEGFGSQTVTNGSTADRQKANTKENDPTGLLNEGFRYRDLQTGSFITRDPLGFKAGPNMYTYVRQNPWTKFDPMGLTVEEKNQLPPAPSDPGPEPKKPKDATFAQTQDYFKKHDEWQKQEDAFQSAKQAAAQNAFMRNFGPAWKNYAALKQRMAARSATWNAMFKYLDQPTITINGKVYKLTTIVEMASSDEIGSATLGHTWPARIIGDQVVVVIQLNEEKFANADILKNVSNNGSVYWQTIPHEFFHATESIGGAIAGIAGGKVDPLNLGVARNDDVPMGQQPNRLGTNEMRAVRAGNQVESEVYNQNPVYTTKYSAGGVQMDVPHYDSK